MKKSYIKLFLLAVLPITTFAQIPGLEWDISLGGTKIEEARSIQKTADDGYIVAGYTYSSDGDVSGFHTEIDNNTHLDAWIVKLNNDGSIAWEKAYGGTLEDGAFSIQQTTDGGYIFAGNTNSTDGDVNSSSQTDYWVVKLDANGTILWEQTYGGTNSDYARSILETEDGGFIVVGYTESFDGDITEDIGINEDIWVVKLSNTGTIQWQKSYGGSYSQRANAIKQTADGGYIFTGYTTSNDGHVSGNHSTFTEDIWVVKINSLGTIEWQKCLGGDNLDIGNDIIQTNDGGYIVVGNTLSNNGDVVGYHGTFAYDGWIVKLSNSGVLEWQKPLGGTLGDEIYDVTQLDNGSFVVVGMSGSQDGDATGNTNYSADFWVVQLNNSGNIIWQKNYGGIGNDVAYSVTSSGDNDIVVAGFSYSGNATGHHGVGDFWVVKLGASAGLEELANNSLIIYPNPTSDVLYLEEEMQSIHVYDLNGTLISTSKNAKTINLNSVTTGIYIVKALTNKGEILTAKIIKN